MEPRQLREILARNVQGRMDKKGWTQPDLEREAKVGQSTVSRLLNKGGSTGLDRIAKIAGALGCQPWELLVDNEESRKAAYERILDR